MKLRLSSLFAIVAVLAVVIAVPASAEKAHHGDRVLHGDQVMILNIDMATDSPGAYGCEEISWFGTIRIDRTTYGMALYSIESVFDDDGLLYYEEGWQIFTRQFRVKNGELKTCEPGRVLLAGTDVGVGDLAAGWFYSDGVVDYASRPFRKWVGDAVYQDGLFGFVSVSGVEDAFGFTGSLTIY